MTALLGHLFAALSAALAGGAAAALGASFAWGILSIILSPCHLASIPLVVGFVGREGTLTTRRAFILSSLFAGGILVSIGAVGGITAAAGRMYGDIGPWGNRLVGAVFVLVGLYLCDLLPLAWAAPGGMGVKRSGATGAFLLGLLFGLALGPCTFAFMAPVLGVVFKTASARPLFAAGLLLAYGIGHCLLIVLAGTYTAPVERYLNWTASSKAVIVLRRVCGALVIAAGLYVIAR